MPYSFAIFLVNSSGATAKRFWFYIYKHKTTVDAFFVIKKINAYDIMSRISLWPPCVSLTPVDAHIDTVG